MKYINKLSKHDIINLIIRRDLDELLNYDISLNVIWNYLANKVSFKKVDYYDFISRLISEDPKKEFYTNPRIITRKVIRAKRFDILRLLLEYFRSFDSTIESMAILCSTDDVERISKMIKKIDPGYSRGIICRNTKLMKYWDSSMYISGKRILEAAIRGGIINVLKKYKNVGSPEKIILDNSNPECVKYLFKYFDVDIKNIDYSAVNIVIAADKDCRKLLDLDNKTYTICYDYSRYSGRFLKKVLSGGYIGNDIKSNLANMCVKHSNLNLLEHILKLGGNPLKSYLCDVGIVCSENNFSIILMKYNHISKEEVIKNLLYVAWNSNNVKVLNYLAEWIERKDYTWNILSRLICDKSQKNLRFILDKYDLDLGKYFLECAKYDHHDVMHNYIDRISVKNWNEGLNEIIKNGRYESYCGIIKGKNLSVPNIILKREYNDRNMIFLGGIPKREVMYKYVSILECKFPELLKDPVLRKISVWHSGRSMRMKEYPGDLLFYFTI